MSNEKSDKCASWNFRSVGWYATFGLLPFGSTLLGLLLLLIARSKEWWTGRKSPKSLPTPPRLVSFTHWVIYLLMGLTTVSGILSPHPLEAILFSIGFILAVFGFIFGGEQLGLDNKDPSFISRYLPLFVINGAIASAISLGRYFFSHQQRADNLFCGINGMGTILIIIGGLAVGYFNWRGGRWRYLMIPYLGLTIAALLATQSRGAWIGFTVMLGCFGIFNRKFMIVVLVLILLAGTVFFVSPVLQQRFASIFSFEKNTPRLEIWQSSLKMIADYPVFGIGAGIYPYLYNNYLIPNATYRDAAFAHNLILQVAVEFGLVGLTLFLLFLGSILTMSFRLARNGNPFYQCMFAVVIGVLVHQQVDIPIWGINIGGAFWMMAGLTIGLYRLEYHRSHPAQSQMLA